MIWFCGFWKMKPTSASAALLVGRVAAVDGDASGRRLGQPVDQPREGRLAGAVEADDADAVFGEAEGQRRQRFPRAETDRSPFEANIQIMSPVAMSMLLL